MKTMKWGHCLSVIAVICLSMMASSSLLHGDQQPESLLLRSVYPDNDLGGLNLYFNTNRRVLPPEDSSAFTITPEANAKIESADPWGNWRVSADLKPQTDYIITLKAGLRSRDGKILLKDQVFSFRTGNMEPSVRKLSEGPFFPASRQNFTIPLSLVNIRYLEVTLDKIYNDNIIPYDYDSDENAYRSERISKLELDLKIPVNTRINYAFDLAKVLPKRTNGIYRLSFYGQDAEKEDSSSTRCYLVLSDMTIIGAADDQNERASFFVRSLKDSSPIVDAVIKLYSRNNRLVGEGKTDQEGKAILEYLPEYHKDNDSINVVTAEKGDDFTFLYMTYNSHDLSVFNNQGQHFNNGPAAFVYTERGVARPGETMVISAFIRNDKDRSNLPPVADAPVVLTIYDPNGNESAPIKLKTDKFGFVSYKLSLPQDAYTGSYYVKIGPEKNVVWGETDFSVATYVPDRIKVSVTPDRVVGLHSDTVNFKINGKYYFGTDVSNGKSSFRVRASLAKPPAHWNKYTVGDDTAFLPGEAFVSEDENFNGEETIAFNGFNSMNGTSYSPVTLIADASVNEPGGRAVTGHATVISLPSEQFLGLRKNQTTAENKVEIAYEILSYEKDKPVTPLSAPVTFKLYKCDWDYTMKKTGYGQLRYEWTKTSLPIGEPKTIDLTETKGVIPFDIRYHGSYELVATCGDAIQTRLEFYYWWGDGGARTANPSVLSFLTDKEIYMPGEKATVTFKANGDGNAFIVCGEDGIGTQKTTTVKAGDNTFTVEIPAAMTTKTYYAAVTVVSHHGTNIDRMFGLLALKIDQSASQLDIKLDAPDVARPETDIAIKATVTNKDGKPASGLIHLFAVDEGILALTDFHTPDIFNFFHGQRFFVPDFYDSYSNIFPDIRISDDGKIGGGGLARVITPVTAKKPAIVVLNPIELSENGTVETTIHVPEHLGAMRLMAVCSATKGVGSADTSFIVRDAISIMPSGPRAVAPGDEFLYTFTLFNHDLPTGDCSFTVTLPPELKTDADTTFTQTIDSNSSKTVILLVKAQDVFKDCVVKSTLKMGEFTKQNELPLTIRSGNPGMAVTRNFTLQPNESKTFLCDPDEWFASSIHSYVTTTSSPACGLEESLTWLNSYPYGCLEQTISKAFPFLQLDALVKAGIVSADSVEGHRSKLFAARDRIMTMALPDGSFSLWPEHRGTHLVASIYATHFLAEAALRDIPVNAKSLKKSCQFLHKVADDRKNPRALRAYCSYVLALAKQSSHRNIAENILKTPENDYAAFIAAAALIKGGHAAKAMDRFNKAIEARVWYEDGAPHDLMSQAARFGMTLSIIMDIAPDNPAALDLALQLRKAIRKDGYAWGTTQANAWGTGALAKFAAHFKIDGNSAATFQADQKEPVAIDAAKINKWDLLPNHTITITNTGTNTLFLQQHIDGTPKTVPPTQSGVVKLTREYLDKTGAPATTFKQGDLITVKITIESLSDIPNLVFADVLPGGMEIEDPTLVTRAAALTDEQAKPYGILSPKYIERRDDRYLLFGDLKESGIAVITYQARAVTCGKYVTPPSLVEAMYAPDLKAVFTTDSIFEVE
jgi:uncharacterized protein YfaS (alpha-2-macroglobulin family)